MTVIDAKFDDENPLRVLMALPDRRVRGGPPSHLYLLRAELQAQGVDVRSFVYGARTHDETGVRRLAGRLLDVLRFPFLLVRHRPAVVQLNSAFDRNGVLRDMLFVPLARLLGQKVLLKFHGSDLEFLEQARGLWRVFQALAVRPAHIVGVLSRAEQHAFQQRFPRVRFELVKNALDFSRYHTDGGFRNRHGIPADKPLLLFIARFIQEKGLEDVVRALPLIRRRHDVHAVFVGDGPARAAGEKLCRSLDLEACTVFTGYLPEDDTIDAYSAADLLVFPTYHQEGMPMVIFHSLASGLPVVTTRIRAAADWLRADEHCVFVPPREVPALAEALIDLLDHPDKRIALALRGREVAARFSKSAVACEFVGLYQSLLVPQKAPAPA